MNDELNKKCFPVMLSVLLLTAGVQRALAQQVAVSFRSTDGNYWRMQPAQTTMSNVGVANVTIRTDQTAQTFRGWGTCFNELDYDAWSLLSEAERTLFVKRAFNPNGDLRLTVGRIPVGASDYACDWYSCDETAANGTNADGTPNYATDFEMEHFTIERDLQKIIPSIKRAQAEQPAMKFWASPWSPPQWMKTNKHYAQRVTGTNGCPFGVPPYVNDQFIDHDDYYHAYCLYFDKFIQAYAEQGIPITGLAYQNEAYSNTPYPGCSWTAATTGKFLANYLGPYMAAHHPDVTLIVGTMNTASWEVYQTILNTPNIGTYCKQVGFQWEGRNQIANVRAAYPQYEMVQTESECGSGTFDWNAAAHTFELCNHYLTHGVTTYTYWNAILQDRGESRWGWIQNALVQVDGSTRTPRYCAEYYAYKHYTHLIPEGSRILTCDPSNLLTSALTPDGNVVVVIGNDGTAEKTLTLDIDGQALVCTLPGKSFTSYVVGTEANVAKMLRSEAQGLVEVERASLTSAEADALRAAVADGTFVRLLPAVAAVESDAHSELLNASFTSGADYWMVANEAAGGDFRAATVQGKTCYNNWSNNFTSLDIHQNLRGLEPGLYCVSAKSLCGEGNITDQHVYAETSAHRVTSPVKKDDVWSADHWETQTTATLYVAEDDELRVGYASTSGGGTRGWFCVTDFVLTRVGDLTEDFDLSANRKADPLEAALEAYQAVVDEARLLAADEAYAENCRADLAALIQRQQSVLATMTEPALVGNLQRELEAQMDVVRAHAEATAFSPAAVGEGSFLLFDLTAGKFLSYNPSGTNFSMLSDTPTRIVLTSNGAGTYAIKLVDVNYLKIGTWNGLYIFNDAPDAANTKWVFTPVAGKENVYTLSTSDYAETAVSGTFYVTGDNASTHEEEAHEFALVTIQEYLNHNSNATCFLASPAITSSTTRGWSRDRNNASGYAEYPAAIQSEAHTGYGISHWAASPRTNTRLIYQTVGDLPAGTYRLEAYAAATVWNDNAGADNRAGVSLFAEGTTTRKETPVTSATYGKYTVYYTLAEGETLTLGLRADGSNQNNWIFLSDVTLTYYGRRLVLDENYREAPEGVGADVLLQRTFHEGWNTLVLPFPLTSSQLTDLLGAGAEMATFTSAEQNDDALDVRFQKTRAVGANQPCLVYVPSVVTVNRTLCGIDCTPVALPVDEGTALSFVGTYTSYATGASPLTDVDYILGTGETFKLATAGTAIRAYRAYLKNNAADAVKASVIRFTVDDTETGVNELPGAGNGAQDQRAHRSPFIYDLTGRRVDVATEARTDALRGVYICEGKKRVF